MTAFAVGCAATPGSGAREAPAPAVETRATRKRVIAAISANLPTLNPSLNSPLAGGPELADLVSAALAITDERGALRPQLAEAVPSIENGRWKLLPDGRMETTWTLKDGAQWHDGAPITAHDLVFTATVGQDRDVAAFGHPAYSSVDSVEAPEPRAVAVKWKRPYIGADAMFTRSIALPLPSHLLERTYSEEKAAFRDHPYWTDEFVGSGPFKVREWVRASHVVLQANDRYVLGRPKLDEIEVRFVPDTNTLAANILAGAVDMTLGRGPALDQAIQVRDQWSEGRIDIGPGNSLHVWPQLVNPSPPIVADARFRRALLHAIDREQMAEVLEAGLVPVAHSWLSRPEPEYREIDRALAGSVVRYEHDPRQASRLIEGLGYTRGTDGVFHDAATQKLSVELRTTVDNVIQPKATLAVADYWQRIGVAVDQVIVPPQRQLDREYRATFPAFELLRGASDLNAFNGVRSAAARMPENNFQGIGGINYARYMNPELDALIDRYFTTIPKSDRLEVVGQIVNHLTDRVIFMGLFYTTEPFLIANRLVNVAGRKAQDSTGAWNSYEWDVR